MDVYLSQFDMLLSGFLTIVGLVLGILLNSVRMQQASILQGQAQEREDRHAELALIREEMKAIHTTIHLRSGEITQDFVNYRQDFERHLAKEVQTTRELIHGQVADTLKPLVQKALRTNGNGG